MSATTSPDRQHQTYAIFNARLRAEIRGLITPALIEEHRSNPLGRHSDALARVVNFLRRPPHYALYSAKPMREWQLIALPIAAGQPPQPLDDVVYTSEEAAIHAVFLRHIADLQAE
jgi:branched-chain amino acid transport system permease protein